MAPFKARTWRKLVLSCALAAWMAMIALGFQVLWVYATTPGPQGMSPDQLPANSSLRFEAGKPTVAMAVHPRCPCTRSSLEALGEILRRVPGAPPVQLLIYRPIGSPKAWGKIRAISGTVLVDDPGGIEAGRLGLATSGAVVVFDPNGRRVFVGGITSSRETASISEGGEALLAAIAGRTSPTATARVFGCSLRSLSTNATNRKAAP